MADYTVKMKFTYADNDTRTYDLTCAANDVIDVEDKINALNASVAAGTDDGFTTFFLSDNGEEFTKITEAQIIAVTETILDLGGNT